MAEITETEKLIYNKYLATSRSSLGRPFKLRKNFEEFELDGNYLYIKKLNLFFNNHKNINMDDFFKAPYIIYDNVETSFDLKFYISRKALKLYVLYQTKKLNDPVDSLNQLFFIKKSLEYILKFCKKNNLNIDEYTNHKTNDMYSFILHLKEHKISIYVLFGFEDAEPKLKALGDEMMAFIFGNLKNKFDIFRTRFYTSKKAKILVKEGIKKLAVH